MRRYKCRAVVDAAAPGRVAAVMTPTRITSSNEQAASTIMTRTPLNVISVIAPKLLRVRVTRSPGGTCKTKYGCRSVGGAILYGLSAIAAVRVAEDKSLARTEFFGGTPGAAINSPPAAPASAARR